MQNIRESLTGRMSRVRLFPMIGRELIGLNNKSAMFSRNFLLKYCDSGGMPGIAFVRDEDARTDLFQDWVDLTCTRDIHQFKRFKFDSDLAFSILKQCCTQVEPSQSSIARALRIDGRKIATHLKALCELFVLTKLDPHPCGKGKSIYLPFDSGVAHFFGASLEKKLHIILVNERMAHNSYFGLKRKRYYYYRSTGKNIIHLIEEDLDEGLAAFEIFPEERVKLPMLELLKAFERKNPKAKCVLFAPIPDAWRAGVVNVCPWESMLA